MMQRFGILTLLIFMFFCTNHVQASHNRAGEITYKWLYGYTYEIVITTYTNTFNTNADRCYDTLYFGDGLSEAVPRINGVTGNLCAQNVGDGVMIDTWIKLNVYKTTHTFPGPNCYTLTMSDPNRNQGVLNIPNSLSIPFFIKSELCIGSFSGPNSSPVLTNPPIDDACVGNCFIHNAGAFDIDGDSLSYELDTCYGDGGVHVFGYSMPSGVSIDPVTGDFVWCSPNLQGEYNFAFVIREWRKDADGVPRQVGYVLRDMQVTVGACNNIAPSLDNINNICVTAGANITVNVSVSDPDPTQFITLTSYGGPYVMSNSPAQFNSTPSVSPANGTFSWNTNCQHVRSQPYMVTVKAEDNDDMIPLIDFETFFITVISPGPTNLVVTPAGSTMLLNWNNSLCNQTGGNYIYRYLIYRADSCVNWMPGPCETGVPSYTGFTLIGFTNGLNDTTFIDNNNGLGLSHGTDYTYVVVALFGDGAQSYASTPICKHLLRDVPIITHADVQITSTNNGEIMIRWTRPVVSGMNPDKLDTLANPGPYEFRLFERTGLIGSFSPIYSVTKNYFAQLGSASDTSFISTNLNTAANDYFYKIDFYCNGNLKGSTQMASSIFLTAQGSDNKILLNWSALTPWNNYLYYIYRETSPGSANWQLLDSTQLTNYTDQPLINGQEHCYKILGKGKYNDPDLPNPLLNFSQEVCATAVDNQAPCAPPLFAEASCTTAFVTLQWNNPNLSCSDDVLKYFIYFKPTLDGNYTIMDSILSATDTILVYDGNNSIAGCFVVTAIDSAGNESVFSNEICLDNCPEYELPNIITINEDNINDFLIPVKNKFIKDIRLKIFDRWGSLVFETSDPAINWNGKNKINGKYCSDGVYFYTCEVNEIRLEGIKTNLKKGWIQILGGKN